MCSIRHFLLNTRSLIIQQNENNSHWGCEKDGRNDGGREEGPRQWKFCHNPSGIHGISSSQTLMYSPQRYKTKFSSPRTSFPSSIVSPCAMTASTGILAADCATDQICFSPGRKHLIPPAISLRIPSGHAWESLRDSPGLQPMGCRIRTPFLNEQRPGQGEKIVFSVRSQGNYERPGGWLAARKSLS